MPSSDTVIIGAGQAGLAASQLLSERGHEHVLLERDSIGQRWRSTTWDSLHLLTPNWINALPGWPYRGPDPDGFSSAAGFADQLVDYAHSFGAPVQQTGVRALHRRGDRFEIVTDQAVWTAGNVIVATGWCDQPTIPAIADALQPDVHQLPATGYRHPDALPPGGVLVVGASATGVQLADELRAAGREVTLAAGRHARVPRSYRGMDIYWWLDRLGILDTTIDQLPDPSHARREPSLQLIGRPDHRSLDLATLQANGVQLTGRLLGIDGHRVRLASDLPTNVCAAERRMRRLLDRIDGYIDTHGLRDEMFPADRQPPLTAGRTVHELDLRAAGITTLLWATGYRRHYPWLQLPVLDRSGEIRQHRGHTPIPGLYVLGHRFQHHRNSNFIGGVGRDATHLADHITGRRHALHAHLHRELRQPLTLEGFAPS
jgi:putative flavoprotein involved in K+ transport